MALVAMALLVALTACSTAQIDGIPTSVGGLPAGTRRTARGSAGLSGGP